MQSAQTVHARLREAPTGDERAAGMRRDAKENQKTLYAITRRPASRLVSLQKQSAHGLAIMQCQKHNIRKTLARLADIVHLL